jgi:hypothetical protein
MVQKLQTITSLLKHVQHLLLSFSPLKQVLCFYEHMISLGPICLTLFVDQA